MIAAPPTAQNVFTFTMGYDRGVIGAGHDLAATLLSVLVILPITWLLAFSLRRCSLTVGHPDLGGTGGQARNQGGWP